MTEVQPLDAADLQWENYSDSLLTFRLPDGVNGVAPALEMPDLPDASDTSEANAAIDIIDTTVGESKEGTRVTKIDEDGNIIITGETLDGETYRFEISATIGSDGIPVMTITGTMTGTGGFTRQLFDDVTVIGEGSIELVVGDMNETFDANSRITEFYTSESFNVAVNLETGEFEQSLEGSERIITTEYEDGTIVETTVIVDESGRYDSEDAVEVVVTNLDGTVTTYEKTEEETTFGTIATWVDDSGNTVELPGEFDEGTSEFVPDGKTPVDPESVRKELITPEDDPTDDTTVVGAPEPIPTPDPDDEKQFDAFVVTLADGTEVVVLVDTEAAAEMGMAPDEVAMAFGERVAKLPPETRALIADMPTFIKSGEDMGGGAASIRNGGESMSILIDVLLETPDDDFNGIMLHEMGHVIEDPDRRVEWVDAVNADEGDVSIYAGSSIREDYAETYALWYLVRSGQITGEEAAAIEAEFENRFAILDDSPDALESLPGAENGTLATTKTLENGDVVETRHELQSDGTWEVTYVRVTRESGLVIEYARNDPEDELGWERTATRPGEDPEVIDTDAVPADYFIGDPAGSDRESVGLIGEPV